MEGEEMQMEAEFNSHLRTTGGDLFAETLKNINFRDKNSDEQFLTLVEAAFYKLQAQEISYISNTNKEDIIDYIKKLNKPGYKNAVSYILGYYASNFGFSINHEKVEMVFNSLPEINKLAKIYPIFRTTKPDVMRYAKLWLDMKK